MAARLNHVASMSDNPRFVGIAYETLFGMWFDEEASSPRYGEVLRDGNVTFNIHPRMPGQRLGLDHFGIEVDDLPATLGKLKSSYPKSGVIERPESCPFPGVLTHDPAGSIFALSEKGSDLFPMPAERSVPINYGKWCEGDPALRYLHHYAIRTTRHSECVAFYEDMFGFKAKSGKSGDKATYLNAGQITLMLIPWSIHDYEGIAVTNRGPDHIGFKVPDAVQMKQEILDFDSHYSPGQQPIWLLTKVNHENPETQIRDERLTNACPVSRYNFTDKDGVYVIVGDQTFLDVLD